MPAGRFVVEGLALLPGTEIELPPEIAHQARDVLRLATGTMLHLLDGVGGEYPAQLVLVERKRVIARIGARQAGHAESAMRVVLCQGMLKAAKYETVLQKCTELGVAAFVPLLCERSVAAEEASESKRRRWAKIVAEAIEQCGGTCLPELGTPRPLTHALTEVPAGGIALIPWEETREMPLRATLAGAIADRGGIASISEVRIFIGPEGGFSAREIELARLAGALPVTLGPRILRAETAAIVSATLALDTFGALG
ncbi:MAG: 16S rRNA (uracil(1498)-N(3))-methyltransferase [Ktedonobacterales bacterium]|jgi:16S rRNA (uracil1498-N3)-methyltransferase|nr:MAG: 16S rRNA (uracil(1498)-N(3))-methyltransferase [Ktedonobacterales bacterium]